MKASNPDRHLFIPFAKIPAVLLVTLFLTGYAYPGSIARGMIGQHSQPSPVEITNLQTEYMETPLGIDVHQPRFSWQMEAASGHGYAQDAYQIVVEDSNGEEVWNTGKVTSDISLHVKYEGRPLEPTTRYSWKLTVWDQDGNKRSNSSWFETGLMNPDPNLSAWDGAKWIGGTRDDMVFYPDYLSVFKIRYDVRLDQQSRSTRAGFIFGANDERLLNKNLNIMGVENKRDSTYITVELDISQFDGNKAGNARLHIYRAGYHPNDSTNTPFATFNIPPDVINEDNKYDPFQVTAECVTGACTFRVGSTADSGPLDQQNEFSKELNLNPIGNDSNYISYPMVAEIGFHLNSGQKAYFSNLQVLNYRHPSNVIFSEELSSGTHYEGTFSEFTDTASSGLSIGDSSYTVAGEDEGTQIIADPTQNAAPMLRTEFNTAGKQIKKARLYATARGIYEMYLNGERVGDRYFTPGLTQYNRHQMYQTYDVTDMINSDGPNALGAWLSEGWWSGNITYLAQHWNFFGDRQSLLAKLVVTYNDGSTDVVTTDPQSWSYYNGGPILYGSYFQGEVYDARKERGTEGWSSPGYHDSTWTKAVEISLDETAYRGSETQFEGRAATFNYDSLQIMGHIGEAPGIVKTRTAESMEEVRPGVFVYDMGQNMVGFPRITFTNTSRGDTAVMRYAEVTYPDMPEYSKNSGMIMMENIRAALTQDRYIMKGAAKEVYQPRFTFHGYRYVEITGLDEPLSPENVKGMVISSVDELASHYETSNDLVNKLWENITWSMRGNFLSIPTDTPARNERMGWSGDISVFSKAATYLGDIDPFLTRHMMAMRDLQNREGRFPDVAPVGGGFGGTLWGSAGIIVAWEAYQQYGDIGLLREHYRSMKDYVEYLNSNIDPETGILHEGPLGDWLSPEGSKNDNTLLWSAYHIRDLEIVAQTAQLLNKPGEAERYRNQYEDRKAHFNQTYLDPESHKTIHSGTGEGNKEGQLVDTQASYAVPLAFNVFYEEQESPVAENLASAVRRQNVDDSGTVRPGFSLMTGFIGTASLNTALSEYGYSDMAYRLLQQTSYPSWLYPVVNGATTIWERLNSYTREEGFGGNNSMNSFNHYAFGAVASWMYNYSLGIQRDPESPGFKHFILQPTPDPNGMMKYAKGHYDSMYGRIESSWADKDGILHYDLSIPANTSATLYLPASSPETVKESGQAASESTGVTSIAYKNGKAVYELVSGTYHFTMPWQAIYE